MKPGHGGHDVRMLPDGSLLCVRCLRPAADTAANDWWCRKPDRGSLRHAASPPPCGAVGGEAAREYERVSCGACIGIAVASPAPPAHDLRAASGIVACAACGRASADLLAFGYCSRRERRYDGPRHAMAFAEDGDAALCGEPAAREQAEAGFFRASGKRPAACPDCMAAVRALPAASALHDTRAADGGVACAACALAAARPSALADWICDGGVFRAAFGTVRRARRVPVRGRRAAGRRSRMREYADGGSHHLPGCPRAGRLPDVTVFSSDAVRHGRLSRIACLPCLGRLDRMPAALA